VETFESLHPKAIVIRSHHLKSTILLKIPHYGFDARLQSLIIISAKECTLGNSHWSESFSQINTEDRGGYSELGGDYRTQYSKSGDPEGYE
jgi:hypothetical protein